jgi:hypothetical protein
VSDLPPLTASRKGISAGIAAIVLAVVAVWIWRGQQANEPPPWRQTEQQQAARCLDHYDELNLPVKAKPVERMLLRQNGQWLRLYVSEPDNWITACQGTLDGLAGNFGTVIEPGPAEQLRFYGGYESASKHGSC